jgi:glycosyltransferase involved in cell wall biosynthesis
MRITQVMLAKGFGGAERLFVDLCRSLCERGLDVQAICHRGSKSAEMLSEHPEIKLQPLKVWGTWDPKAASSIAGLVAQHKSQIVQAHLARAALLAGRACKKLTLPIVVTTHNYIDIKYYKHVSMLIPPTKDLHDYYLGQGVAADRLKIINHFSAIKPNIKLREEKEDTIRIVAHGRLVRKKGYHLLLDAAAILKKEVGLNYELLIAGTGPEQSALLQRISDLGLENSVTLTGWTDNIERFLGGGDVFVLPSLDEPFGIVILEAMAMGLPVVSMDAQGPKEILDTDCAWFFKTGESASLAKALQAACDDPQERKRKSDKALQKFKNTYSKQVVIPEFIALYESLLAKQTKASPR